MPNTYLQEPEGTSTPYSFEPEIEAMDICWVDDSGCFIVDESGCNIIFGETAGTFTQYLNEIEP